jgi:hypothetical protein
MEQKVTELLETLSKKLGVTISHLWDVLVNQAFVFGIYSMLIELGSLCFLIIFVRYCKKNAERLKEVSFDDLYFMVGACVSIILLIVSSLLVYDTITALVNPEYWALEKVLKLCK